MQQRRLLRVLILCEAPLEPALSMKLLHYFKPCIPTTHISICEINPKRRVICIPRASCDPMLNTEFSFVIKTQSKLYEILITLINFAIKHLNQTEYHPTGDDLTIVVPSTPSDDLSYTFGWRLDY